MPQTLERKWILYVKKFQVFRQKFENFSNQKKKISVLVCVWTYRRPWRRGCAALTLGVPFYLLQAVAPELRREWLARVQHDARGLASDPHTTLYNTAL